MKGCTRSPRMENHGKNRGIEMNMSGDSEVRRLRPIKMNARTADGV